MRLIDPIELKRSIAFSSMVHDGKTLEQIIDEQPSVEPKIIRCKDCKYRMPYDWMFNEISETWQSQNIDDYPEDEIGCLYCDMAMKADDYCSRAERKTDGYN